MISTWRERAIIIKSEWECKIYIQRLWDLQKESIRSTGKDSEI